MMHVFSLSLMYCIELLDIVYYEYTLPFRVLCIETFIVIWWRTGVSSHREKKNNSVLCGSYGYTSLGYQCGANVHAV